MPYAIIGIKVLNYLFTPQIITLISQKALAILFILLVGEVAKKIVKIIVRKTRLVSEKIGRNQARIKTLRSLIINSTNLFISFIVLMMIFSELGVDIAPLIASAGILGLAVGFGAKDLVGDMIGGFFIILEDQFNVGDEVQIGPHQGQVKKISLRTITLKDKEGKVYFLPNSTIKAVIKLPEKKTS